MEDIIDILKMGLPGLVFLLSMFSYRLLTKEQDKEHPSPAILKTIKQYIYVNVALAMLTMASPIIDYKFFGAGSSTQYIQAKMDTNQNEAGIVAVCHGAPYTNRYLLIKDVDTDRMVQVFANRIVPCAGDEKILMSGADAKHLGWNDSTEETTVEVVSALPGYKFII